MRTIPASMDGAVVAEVDARLDAFESTEHVAIPWAIESGSRAWGFPSPDSDYDCRFFYVRRPSAYLSLWTPRDVLESPVDKVFDVNGWDLGKALRLLVKGNAVVGEWLRSPIVYRGDAEFRDAFRELAERITDPVLTGRHHLHVAQKQVQLGYSTLKRVFYALRPAVTLRWLRVNRGPVPPMNLFELMDSAQMPHEVREQAEHLVDLKSRTRELGPGPVPPAILAFIDDEVGSAVEYDDLPVGDRTEAARLADVFFREWAHRIHGLPWVE